MFKLNDLFHTIQGEGAHVGRRALFIRLPYCDLKCTWCDTEFNSFKDWSCNDFTDFLCKEPCRFAVITGGEPAMNKQLPNLLRVLKIRGFEVAIETNGHFPIDPMINFVTVSPKAFTATGKEEPFFVCDSAWQRANEFKYVVDAGFNFKILDRHNVKDGKRYSLSPEFGNFKENIKTILAYTKEHPGWRISLQTHKWMGIP